MKVIKKKTPSPNAKNVTREWLLIDAKGQTLGRLSSRIALVLRGKNKPCFSPHVLCGDFVVVINAQDIVVTGNKGEEKMYEKYTGYRSGHKYKTYNELKALNAVEPLRQAIEGMLPKNLLQAQMMNSLKIYEGAEHPHAAQNLKKVEL